MGIWSWAKTAAGNRLVGSINWQEGQAPSTINDSAVAEMADVAKWRDDIGGALTSTGSAGVYALTTNSSIASLGEGVSLTFKANHASPGASTLNVDGKGAKKILVIDDDGERELDADEIDADGFYQVFYDPAADSSAGAWILTGVSSSVAADSLKLGGVLASAYALAADVTTALADKLDSASYTAADVLAKLKTVDGAGSGLNADLLDGYEASAFALAGGGAVGVGQTWQDVSASRSGGTTYQNTTGAPIQVLIHNGNDGSLLEVSDDGTTWVSLGYFNYSDARSAIIPNNHYYRLGASAYIFIWAELR